jgi:hypothetical protein
MMDRGRRQNLKNRTQSPVIIQLLPRAGPGARAGPGRRSAGVLRASSGGGPRGEHPRASGLAVASSGGGPRAPGLAVAGAEDEGLGVGGLAGLHARAEELGVAAVELGAGGAPAVLHGGGDGLLEALVGRRLEAVVPPQVLAEAQVGGVAPRVVRARRARVRRAEAQGFGAAGVEPADCAGEGWGSHTRKAPQFQDGLLVLWTQCKAYLFKCFAHVA